MVKVLEATEIDPLEELNVAMTPEEEAEAMNKFAPVDNPGDLSDGGMVGGVKLTPMSGWGGTPLQQGRPAALRAWMWNGTESMLPLAYNPEGTQHDYAMHYRRKRHCLCCGTGGFFITRRSPGCPNCIKINCDQCRASTDTTKAHELASGKTIKGWIIPNFYLSKEQVPFPVRFYGSIPCFLEFCPRRGMRGFLTYQAMVMHADSLHRMEWRAELQAQASARTDEVETLRRRLDAMQVNQTQPPVRTAAAERMAKARAAKKNSGMQNQA